MTPEFSRTYRVDTLGETPRHVTITAEPSERAALARRFALVSIDSLSAEADLTGTGETVTATGRLSAEAVQSCVASGEPVPERVDVPFRIEFRPEPGTQPSDEEVELTESELDVIFFEGAAIDLGEAVAETLSLSLDPYPRSPNADAALRDLGVKSEGEAGPFGALAGLRDKLKDL